MSLDELRAVRQKKLQALKDAGMDAYPVSTEREYPLAEAAARFKVLSRKKSITLAGRLTALRGQGGVLFFDLHDGTGAFQGMVKRDALPARDFELFESAVDIGDFVEVSGTLFETKRKEKTLLVARWRMLAKSLRPLPEKRQGLQDVEERFRRRYLDVLMNEVVRERFRTRSRIVRELRKVLDEEGFLEVETSMLQHLPGGANAEPFRTHHNYLDADLFLRIAPELDLKRLLIGGFPKVYELGRSFRNEAIDATHNPEFTTVEWYEAYADAEAGRARAEKTLKAVIRNTLGKTSFSFDGSEVDFGAKFALISFFDLLKRYALIPHPERATAEELALTAKRFGVPVAGGETAEKLMDAIYKRTCRPKLIQPTFIVRYPANMIPLAKRAKDAPELVDAFQLVAGGIELVKAFSEQNDPLDQAARFAEQEKARAAGDKEAQTTDADFLEALEYGMPTAVGVGLSIDRLSMLLTDARNIREVIFFPTLRPKKS